ncbi:hypothetical protein [Desulfocurvus sp. DL9XJH121]
MLAHIPAALLRALLPAAALAATLAGCMPSTDAPFSFDTASIEERLLAESSDADILDKGVELFRAGQYDAAARRLGVLAARNPHDFEAVARLGLALWFNGRPGETTALWQGFSSPGHPEREAVLRARAEGLGLLADRLRARRMLEDFQRGVLARAVPGTVAVLAAPPGDGERDPGAPRLDLGLEHVLLRALDQNGPLRPAPGGLVDALRAEAGKDRRPGGPLRLARILGAEYSLALSCRTPREAPEILRTRLTVQATEAMALRALRLHKELEDARGARMLAESDVETLAVRRGRCAEALAYYRNRERQGELVALRDREAAVVSRLNREGDAPGALAAIKRYHLAEEALAEVQARIREYERRAVPSLDEAGRSTARAFDDLARHLDGRLEQASARLDAARRREAHIGDLAAVDWRAQRSEEFDLPLAYLSRWPGLAVAALARLAGVPAPEAPGQEAPGPEALAVLHLGLRAREDGEYDLARSLFRSAGIADAPTHPGLGFDLLRLADLPPDELAARLERTILRDPGDAGWED